MYNIISLGCFGAYKLFMLKQNKNVGVVILKTNLKWNINIRWKTVEVLILLTNQIKTIYKYLNDD